MTSIIYILLFNLLFSVESPWSAENTAAAPVLKLNFYLMGREDVDQEAILKIGENIEYLNQEFEGSVKFELNQLFMDYKHEFLPKLYTDYIEKTDANVHQLVDGIEEEGAINIYLLETFTPSNGDQSLMGFTPILRGMHRTYEDNSPSFDRMFLAYKALRAKSTIVHEMGHFLGLSHPWEMNSLDIELLGLNNTQEMTRNHMTYNPDVDKFTPAQLHRMRDFAKRFRKYLLKT